MATQVRPSICFQPRRKVNSLLIPNPEPFHPLQNLLDQDQGFESTSIESDVVPEIWEVSRVVRALKTILD
jgi:hypothetical protein